MALALALICVGLLAALIYEKWQNSKDRRERDNEWRLERAGLLTRIQHPEIVVGEAQPVPDEELRDLEPDEIDLVGTVVNNGNGD